MIYDNTKPWNQVSLSTAGPTVTPARSRRKKICCWGFRFFAMGLGPVWFKSMDSPRFFQCFIPDLLNSFSYIYLNVLYILNTSMRSLPHISLMNKKVFNVPFSAHHSVACETVVLRLSSDRWNTSFKASTGRQTVCWIHCPFLNAHSTRRQTQDTVLTPLTTLLLSCGFI